ncbi:TetR/AcrR family transcriptional regulator [Phytoactinopolyspora alkaliphila]|uniref:TetR/AcrR family transcriptional regulator n=1 Tax=Phytoactinopolyspora alkaliphila TaxID=1783498 RepID=A0A6N9YGZ0_9ACTN|nr:TetR/AcrR family transcriptional regulator [Phytoactinopolyspora alkaliphila]NED94263.1 TetR/AcrR family transcriptional regulator [Phytoactinopolyspora alkaliphila]
MSTDHLPPQEPARMLELLWGTTEPPTRGPKPGLSVAKIVETAVRIADEEGLAAVSMRRVAEELGFTTMSLYRYVSSKDDLLELMQDAAAVPSPDIDFDAVPDHWRDAAKWWASNNLVMFRRHPWFMDIPLSGPPMGPNQVRWMERFLRALEPTGLSPGEKMGILTLISTYALSAGRLEHSLTQAASKTGVEPDAWDPLYGEMLAKVIDPVEFPALTEVLQSGIFSGPADSPPDEIAFGLEVILDGVEALIARRRGESTAPSPP